MVTIAIHHSRLIDGTGAMLEPATVLIRGPKVLAVGPSRELSIPKGCTRIDGRGLTVLPGLIDCHVHLCLGGEPDVVATVETDSSSYTLLKSARHARMTLEGGVTTV